MREITKDDNNLFAGEINIVKKRHERPQINATLSGGVGILRHLFSTTDEFNFQNKHWDVSASVDFGRNHQENTYHQHRDYLDSDGSVTSTQMMTNKKNVVMAEY